MSELTTAVAQRIYELILIAAGGDDDRAYDQTLAIMADLTPLLEAAEAMRARLKRMGEEHNVVFGVERGYDAARDALVKDKT